MSERNSHLLVAHSLGNFSRPDVGVRHAQIFRLTAGIAAEQMRIAEQASRGMAPKFLYLGLVGVGPLAARVEAALAEKALAARDGERYDDAIASLESLDIRTDLDDLAHRLMTEHIAAFHLGHDAIEQMQVRSVDPACGHFYNGIARMLDRRIRHAFAPDVAFAMPRQRFHSRPSAQLFAVHA
jgi:hypothetical protein